MNPNFYFEDRYKGSIVAGIDEAGRGPLMGPVITAAVIIDRNIIIPGIKDSKLLTASKRYSLYEQIIKYYKYSIGIATAAEIDNLNILQATILACKRAAFNLSFADIFLVDGNMKFNDAKYISIIKGDQISYSIAAASIIAKVTRDKLIEYLSKDFPHYGWDSNKGYGTISHINAIKNLGITNHHRKSFLLKILNPETVDEKA